MKKIIALIMILSTSLFSAEIFREFHVMNSIMLDVSRGKTYTINTRKYKAIAVNRKMLKNIGTTDDLFFMIDTSGKKVMVRIGDYLIAPSSLSEIYGMSKEDFNNLINK